MFSRRPPYLVATAAPGRAPSPRTPVAATGDTVDRWDEGLVGGCARSAHVRARHRIHTNPLTVAWDGGSGTLVAAFTRTVGSLLIGQLVGQSRDLASGALRS
ncbi:hypothetical protein GCM10019016_016330 [Streptomyces prasinosporus]|uniref:Uncharacterized protein n=1 Tax=Streptomyces prasinosporus TaxID=68256 RepID=A0ABP6TJ44_9ACTN